MRLLNFGTQRPTFFYPNPAALTPCIPHQSQSSVPIAPPALNGRTIAVALGLPLVAHEPCTTPLPQDFAAALNRLDRNVDITRASIDLQFANTIQPVVRNLEAALDSSDRAVQG